MLCWRIQSGAAHHVERGNVLKRSIVKEELVALTGDWLSAAILNQFLYWSERTKDTDDYVKEEKRRAEAAGLEDTLEALNRIPLRHGWIFKKSSQLAEELVHCASEDTIRRRIKTLVKQGLLDERRNPYYAWDRTLQYRPNRVLIQQELEKMGYALEDYQLYGAATDSAPAASNRQPADSRPQVADSNPQAAALIPHGAGSIPENTTEITPETTAENTPPDTDEDVTFQGNVGGDLFQFILECGIRRKQAILLTQTALKHEYKLNDLHNLWKYAQTRPEEHRTGWFITAVKDGYRPRFKRRSASPGRRVPRAE